MRTLALIPAVTLIIGGFAASPVLADTKEDYMAACMKASGDNTELCTCKTTEALKVADDEMLGFIIMNLNDPQKFNDLVNKGEVPKAVVDKWVFYVRDTNKICLPPSN